MVDVSNKRIIITGGAQGIGRATAELLLKYGAKIVIIDIVDELAYSDTAKDLLYVKANLLAEQELITGFNQAIELLDDKIDVLINSAGIIKRGPAFELTNENWHNTLQLNVVSVFALSQLVANLMKDNGGGKIINFGSILSNFGGFNAFAYSTSKGAITQLTKSLSNEWAQYGIQVNAVAPGYMQTQMNNDLMNDPVRAPQVVARIPAQRWGTAEDVAKVVLFLSSELSDYVTGTIIPVDGGVLGR